jgi:hypothetical protein
MGKKYASQYSSSKSKIKSRERKKEKMNPSAVTHANFKKLNIN